MILTAKIDKCNGCKLCEIVCSLYHDNAVNTLKSRIEIVRIGAIVDVPIFCFQCDDPVCMQACTVNAITRDEANHVRIDKNLCINCKACAIVCPFGAIGLDATGRIFKCDLCDPLKPQCVEICPNDALSFEHPEKLSYQKKMKIAEKLLI